MSSFFHYFLTQILNNDFYLRDTHRQKHLLYQTNEPVMGE